MNHWTDKAEEVCRAGAGSDLAGVPVYIFAAADVPPELRPVGAAGFTAPFLSDALRPWLESQGRWQGAGFATVIDAAQLPADPWNLIAAAVHELAHYIEYRALARSMGVDELPIATAALVASCREPLEAPAATKPWAMHDCSWIRAAIHLRHRAVKANHWFSFEGMHVSGTRYGLGCAWHYAELLADELESTEPITAVLQTEAPREFTMQIESDKAKHIGGTNHPESSRHVCTACPAWRKQSGRPNFTIVYDQGRDFELVECKVCGRHWRSEK